MKKGNNKSRTDLTTRLARATVRNDRDLTNIIDPGLVAPNELPQRPDWLTPAGEEVWIDNIGRLGVGRLSGESDTDMFANYCNLQGAIIQTWRALAAGDPEAKAPPPTALAEVRKLQEMLGIAGVKSRVVKGAPNGSGGQQSTNLFSSFRR